MRRRLPCDCERVAIDPDGWGDTEANRSSLNEAIMLWREHGSRVVLLTMEAAAALHGILPEAALASPALSDSPRAVYVSSTEAHVPGIDGPIGIYCIPSSHVAGQTEIRADSIQDIDGLTMLLSEEWSGQPGVQRFLTGPVPFRLGGSPAIPPGAVGVAVRTALAAYAAIHDPLRVRRVLPGVEAAEVTPTAPRRARRRGDPRAQTYRTVRLTPDARHVVREKGPPIRCDSPAPTQRRAGRGIRLGEPMAEHDVRGHYRRILTTEARALEHGWTIYQVLAPESARPNAPQPVRALVPVRPHTRGRGPRRATDVIGPR